MRPRDSYQEYMMMHEIQLLEAIAEAVDADYDAFPPSEAFEGR